MSDHLKTEKPKTVTVTALKDHTNDGQAYTTGDTYEADASQVESLVAQGMAKPADEADADAPHKRSHHKRDE